MFITFEGIEGSGKGTLMARVGEWLRDRGRQCLHTREPGGSELGKTLRTLLLDTRSDVTPRAELFLYLADRAQHVAQVVRPALAAGSWVLCDRYADSTIVYQGFGRGLDVEELFRLNEVAVEGLWPSLTILLDVSPEMGLARARGRNAALGLEVTEGRFEAEAMEFHRRTREGYLHWAERQQHRFRIVDGTPAPDVVFAAVRGIIETMDS